MNNLDSLINFDPDLDFEATPIWVLDVSHSVPPWTPLFAWYWAHPFNLGCCGAKAEASLPYDRTTLMRLMNGGVYYGFSPVEDEAEIKDREAAFKKFILPYLEDYDTNWKGRLENELLGHYERLKSFDVDNSLAVDLWEHVEDCISVNRRMGYLHVLGMYVTWLPYMLLEYVCKQIVGIDDTHPTFLKLVTGFDNKIFEVDKKLLGLSKKAKKMGLDGVFFESESAGDVIPQLEKTDQGREWLMALREFLQEDGWRMPRRAAFIEPTWIEEPTPAIGIIKIYLKQDDATDLKQHRKQLVKDREAAEKEILSKIPAAQKEYFIKLLKLAQNAGAYAEGHSYYCEDYCFSLTRRAFMAIGRRYVAAGCFDAPDDIFFLMPEEIAKVIYAPQQYNLRAIVNKRREDWQGWCKEGNPPFMLKEGTPPESIGPHLQLLGDPIFYKAILGAMPQVKPELGADLYGVVGSTGIAEGPARVILDEKDLKNVEKGDILVASNTAPSWTPVFHLIKGAIIDRGGSLAHAAVVGREFGIPVVLNVFDGTRKIKSGQRVRVDANMGTVYFLDK